ncbi:MAG: membrane protein insertase YidC [Gammaproteobacteria bacterium]|nr:membrane protein insertase YidC [Gammaproteobacteria bacterium]
MLAANRSDLDLTRRTGESPRALHSCGNRVSPRPGQRHDQCAAHLEQRSGRGGDQDLHLRARRLPREGGLYDPQSGRGSVQGCLVRAVPQAGNRARAFHVRRRELRLRRARAVRRTRYQKLDIEDDEDQAFQGTVTNGWIAGMQHHFVAAAVPARDQAYAYRLQVNGRQFLLSAVGPTQTVEPGSTVTLSETLFIGPKLQKDLEKLHPELDRTADYGMLTIIAKPLFTLLGWVHGVVGNWGWAIIIVTFLIKLVFYPLSEASGRSMAKMRALAPRIKNIQERYKDDKEQLGRQMMELYKREKINPVAGCLPILIQIPVFLAFYWVLLESVEMRQAPFVLWINDLSARDPIFILPILMGVAMFGQYKLNPAPPDPIQAKVFMFMPVIMTVMFAWFPAGLVLYWLTNTLLSIAQQWRINRVVEAQQKRLKAD